MKIHFEEENNFIEYYSLLDWESKKDLLQRIINAKNTNTSPNFIEKINFLYRRLMMSCRMNKLTKEENDLFLGLSSRYITNNEELDDDLLNEYVNNYLLKNPEYKGEEIIIYLNYFRCFLNSFYNKEVIFDFQNRFHNGYEFGIPIESNLQYMMVNVCAFRKILNNIHTIESYYCHLVHISFSMLHEYAHLLQKDYINNYNNQKTENYIIEKEIMKEDNEFYKKYHDYFEIEKEADEFAYTHINYFLDGIIPKEQLKYYLEIILKKIELRKIDNKEIFELEKEKRKRKIRKIERIII